jgi:PKHD-type hydroxylase
VTPVFPFSPSPDAAGEERPYATKPGVFSREETETILATARLRARSAAEVGRAGEVDLGYRSAALTWLHPADMPWVFERLAAVIRELNGRWFGFDLTGFHDPLQVTRYEAAAGGQYDWHTDRGTFISGNPPRKLTVVVQLTEPDAYDGGDLELLTARDPLRVDRQIGGVHVFPSFVLHRVSPVTSGARVSLVGWVVGPRFR